MSWSGGGNFNRLFSWTADALANIDITASRMDSDTTDITSNGFGNTLTRDGQGSATANLPMNAFKHTNVGNGVAATDYAAFGQLNNNEGVAGGRLTLVTGVPVLLSNQTAIGTIFYTPYLHDFISIYNGTNWKMYQFTEQTVTLDATNFLSGNLYDLFMFLVGTTPELGYGPAWTNSTTRSAAISRVNNGVWSNTSTITLRQTSGSTSSVSAGQATYVGTALATANAQTGMNLIPAAASLGSNNILGLFNAYNRVPTGALMRTTTASWSYDTNTWRAADNSATMRITYVDGLGVVNAKAIYTVPFAGLAVVGVNINSTSATPAGVAYSTASASGGAIAAAASFLPVLGSNFLQAMEAGDGSTATTWLGQTTLGALTFNGATLHAWLDL